MTMKIILVFWLCYMLATCKVQSVEKGVGIDETEAVDVEIKSDTTEEISKNGDDLKVNQPDNEAEETGKPVAPEFRTKKIRHIWKEAESKVASTELDALRLMLTDFDTELLQLKHEDRANAEKRLDLYDRLKESLKQFTIENAIPIKWIKEAKEDARERITPNYADNPELIELYQRAVDMGMSANELERFSKRLDQHQERILKLQSKQEVLESLDDTDEYVKRKKAKLGPKQAKLAQDMKDIAFQLESLMSEKTPSGAADGSFHEPDAQELWEAAKKANFTEDELAGVKADIHHFQNRVKKHKHVQLAAENEIEESGVTTKLKENLVKIGENVQKLYKDLRNRINERQVQHGGEL